MNIPESRLQTLTPASLPPALVEWATVMKCAVAAHRSGLLLAAMAFYRQAVALARKAQRSTQPSEAQAAVPALVASSEGLAALNEEQDRPDLAASVLSELHTALLEMVRSDPLRAPRRQAALRHCHDTHGALMALAEVHGWSPVIEAAVRAGCMRMRFAAAPQPV